MLLEVCQKNAQKHCQTYNAEANVADNFLSFFRSIIVKRSQTHTFHVPPGRLHSCKDVNFIFLLAAFSLNKLKWPHFSFSLCFCYCYNYLFFLVFAWRAPYFLQEFTFARTIY